jgi:holo-[acyl-carrier protein] synthase
MILPTASPNRNAYKSVPPRGLILDEAYTLSYTETFVDSAQGLIKKHGARSHVNVNELDGQLCEVSISHDGDFATAVALVPSRQESSSTTESHKADEGGSDTDQVR